MERQAVITVINKQVVDGQEESIEVVTPGKFYQKGGSYYVVYEETQISGMEGTTTTLKIEDKKVTLIRFGTTVSRLSFQVDVKNTSLYKTPFGIMEITVKPSAVDINIDDMGGEVKLFYELEVAGSEVIVNELIIKIR